jgi:flagellar hook-length control protein FliK
MAAKDSAGLLQSVTTPSDASPNAPDEAPVLPVATLSGSASVALPGDAGAPALDSALAQSLNTRGEPSAMAQITRPVLHADGTVSLMPAANAPAPLMGGGPISAPTAPLDAMPVLQPLADPDAWSQNLGDRLLMMAENGMQSARLKLHPEHLGPLEIRISVDDNGASRVSFSAHHPQTREALEHAIPKLRELFADQGLNLAHANVDSGRGAFAQRDMDARSDSWREWTGDDFDEPLAPLATAWSIGRASERRVDVFV